LLRKVNQQCTFYYHNRLLSLAIPISTSANETLLPSIAAVNLRHANVPKPPKIPCLFPEFSYETPVNVDLFNQPFATSSLQDPFVIGAINTFCRLSVLMSEVQAHGHGHSDNKGTGVGAEEDLGRTNEFYKQLKAMGNSLPSALRYDLNFTPQTCFLR
jgi:hypothetical protein